MWRPIRAIRPCLYGRDRNGRKAVGSTASSWLRRRWTSGDWSYETFDECEADGADTVGATCAESSTDSGRAASRAARAAEDCGDDPRERQRADRGEYAHGERERRDDHFAGSAAGRNEADDREHEDGKKGGSEGCPRAAGDGRRFAGAGGIYDGVADFLECVFPTKRELEVFLTNCRASEAAAQLAAVFVFEREKEKLQRGRK